MDISEFFKIFDLNRIGMNKVNYYVHCHDYTNAKRELLKYFINRKANCLSSGEPIDRKDSNFPLAYIARHNILSGPNEDDCYLSSMFIAHGDDYTSLDIMPFLKSDFSFMLMSRQKEKEGALLYSPSSIFPPYISITTSDGKFFKIMPSKYAYISTKSPDSPLSEEDIYDICEESDSEDSAYGVSTGRAYFSFDLSQTDLSRVSSARFTAKISLGDKISTKELLLFNISDASWNSDLTWNKVKGNVYSWESSPTGPSWISPAGSDDEYLNVTCRFWFARPMAYQYLSDVEKNKIYGEKLLFLMDAFSNKKDGGFNRVLETGERLSNFTSVLHNLVDTPVMTPDHLTSILWMMYRDMKSLMENPDAGWSNWAVVRTSGLSKAIDFLPELKEHENWKKQTRSLMNDLFDRMYSPDFSFRESGFGYSFWCVDLFASAVKSAHVNNDPYSSFMRSRIEKSFDASLDLLYPDLYDTNIGDSNYQSKADYIEKIGSLFPTKKLKAILSGNNDSNIPTSYYYPYANTVVMRNKFGIDDSVYILMQSTPFDGHAHNDLSNIIMYAYGRPLITDTGRYGYSESGISTYLRSPQAHNTVEIEGFLYSPHSKSNPKTKFVSSPVFDYAESVSNPYQDIECTHCRRVLFLKRECFAIVSDYVETNVSQAKFDQNWHFMPGSNPSCDYNNHISTSFGSTFGNLLGKEYSRQGNIKLVCPDTDTAIIQDDVFSSGYGIAQKSKMASFTKCGQNMSMTTLLLPYKGEESIVSSYTTTPIDLSSSSAVFDIGSSRCVFYAKNTTASQFSDCTFDGDIALLINGRMYLSGGCSFLINNRIMIKSPTVIKDIYIQISSGIVEIESNSLRKCTKKDEAIRIYAPKTTHVLLNGESIPFTLYSDYVYAVAANEA